MINVDKYFFTGKYRDLVLDEYYRMIDWLTEHISEPAQGYEYKYNKSALGRHGLGWELRLHWVGEKTPKATDGFGVDRRQVEWHMFIEDDEYAVMFKLMWP
jgi:hypothetical protein